MTHDVGARKGTPWQKLSKDLQNASWQENVGRKDEDEEGSMNVGSIDADRLKTNYVSDPP